MKKIYPGMRINTATFWDISYYYVYNIYDTQLFGISNNNGSSKHRLARIALANLLGGIILPKHWPVFFKTKKEVIDFCIMCM